eukprot:TRINITY_DN6184_c0_g2_i1.p1 TRINITY_DN6184_c0_g2~~TRINITY_DN6184_c0_g2_i1.p1  ORF type:complete len:100 (-),score=13.12 TRINITY_DN6184_c0_g2_i1:23-322(-)
MSSFEALKLFHEQLVTFRSNPNVPIIVVGNKSDNESNRQIKKEDGQKFASCIHADFIESSAKNDINVTQIFKTLFWRVCAQNYPATYEAEEKKCCCLLL